MQWDPNERKKRPGVEIEGQGRGQASYLLRRSVRNKI